MTSQEIIALKDKIKSGYAITPTEAQALTNSSEKETLYACANEIREHFCGNKIDLCSITNAKSGKCSENCKWCSQSAWHKTDIETYPLVDKQAAVSEALSNRKQGVARFSLVSSGRTATDAEIEN